VSDIIRFLADIGKKHHIQTVMKPKAKITTYYLLQLPGIILNLTSCLLISLGKPVEKAFPITIIGCVLITCSLFFQPRKKDFEAMKNQKS
jgi:hypothetical protein